MSVCVEQSRTKIIVPTSQTCRDKKDEYTLDQILKNFAMKFAHIIVQSRQGEPVTTKCNPDLTQTWFNLALGELPEVAALTRKTMDAAGTRLPLCVEIYLRTSDEEIMALETWMVRVEKDKSDLPMIVTNTLYNDMNKLLKSLLTLTRQTPAYRLSRNKSDYVIDYKIYCGEPQLDNLGTNCKLMRVGDMASPVGRLCVSVMYRTNLIISPQHIAPTGIMVKSDHFSGANMNSHGGNLSSSTCDQPVKMAAFADKPKLVEPEPVDIPFSNLLRTPQQSPPSPAILDSGSTASTTTNDNVSVHTADSDNGNVTQPADEPFVLLDLKTPFAGKNANTELGIFYRECVQAPQLHTTEDEVVEEQVGDLALTLELFETSLHEYDNVLTSVCLSDNNN